MSFADRLKSMVRPESRKGVWLKTLISLGILAFILWRVPFHELGSRLASADPLLLGLVLALKVAALFVAALRWAVLLRVHGVGIPPFSLFKYYCFGHLWGNVLPTAIGGDIVRVYYLSRHDVRGGRAVGTVVAERFAGLVALCPLALAGVFISNFVADPRYLLVALGVILAMAATIVGAVLLFSRTGCGRGGGRLGGMARDFSEDFIVYSKHPVPLFIVLLLSVLFQFLGIICIYLTAIAIGDQSIGLAQYCVILPIVWIISILPVSLNGLGVREASFIYLASVAKMGYGSAFSISLIWLGVIYASSLMFWMWFMIDEKKKRRTSAAKI